VSDTAGRFEGKRAVVTGGSSGMGAACVVQFEAEGAECHVLDVADSANPVDVTDEAAVERFFAALPAAPDIVVNAAGVGFLARVVDCSFTDWQRVIGINLHGTFLCLRAAARRMVAERRSGAIVNITSINEEWPLNGFGPYCVSKAGAAMLTRVAALELAPHGIRVNAVAPGPIDTPMTLGLREVPQLNDAVGERTPYQGRFGSAAEVAAVIAFLASDEGRWVVGRSLAVDGGQLLAGEPDFLRILEANGLWRDTLTP
jgi:NAD(P)-dependent dehydrogenase (short-subunit alcohol dehydrogenase family)